MGTVACRACKGSGRFYAKSGKAFDCRACGGTGVNKDLWSTRCERCRTEIIYKAGTNTPQFCKSCRDIDLEKPCAQMGCTNVIRYKVGWKNVSNYCKRCENKRREGWSASTCPGTGMWGCGKLIWSPPGKKFTLCPDCSAKQKAERESKKRTKPCKRPGCRNEVVYYTDWERIPDICSQCKAKGADLFRADLIPAGWNVKMGKMYIDEGHITMVFTGKGTGGANYHVSWDGYGDKAHYTDQGLPKGHPRRHRDPRRDP
jgi:hypothetical protein